jgi:hypothetical protein
MRGKTQNAVRSLLIEGLCDKEICARLNLSSSGVKYHVQQIFRQYGLFGGFDSRRLIVILMREEFARLTNFAAATIVPASTRGRNQNADHDAQL